MILGIWLKETPPYAAGFIQLFLINALVESYTFTIGTSVQATGIIRNYMLIVSGINLLMLPVACILYTMGYNPYVGIIGLVVVNIIGLQLRVIYISRLGISYRLYFKKVFIPTLACFAIGILYSIIIHINMVDGILPYLGYTSVGCILLLIAIWLIGLNKREKQLVDQIIKKTLRTK